jgi:hypothetical protein
MSYPFDKKSEPFFSAARNGFWGGVPWVASAHALEEPLRGQEGPIVLWPGSAVMWQSDADIDTDGPGGSKAEDPDWLPETSLRDANGRSCNSRTFAGVVVPPQFRTLYGVRTGDYAMVVWNGIAVACQVYDIGPKAKLGEISLCTGKMLGIPKVSGRVGHSKKDIVTIAFPRSGPRVAVFHDTHITECTKLWNKFTGR